MTGACAVNRSLRQLLQDAAMLKPARRAPAKSLPGGAQRKDEVNRSTTKEGEHMAKKQRRYVVIGNEGYGLYCGWIEATDAEILVSKAVRLYESRHIRYWYGGTGGITSLAAWGPCGPRAKESRIGAPCPSSLITEVRAVHECSAEAKTAFDAIGATR